MCPHILRPLSLSATNINTIIFQITYYYLLPEGRPLTFPAGLSPQFTGSFSRTHTRKAGSYYNIGRMATDSLVLFINTYQPL